MKRRLVASLLAAVSIVSLAHAQTPAPGREPQEDPFARLWFPPELVLQHSQDIGLSAEQRNTIVQAIKAAQGDLFDLQLQMSDRNRELMKLVRPEAVPVGDLVAVRPGTGQRLDEAAVLALVDRILAVERDIKRRQLQLFIRIRNELTPEQQGRLNLYRDRPGRAPPDGAPF